jgi:hypothetical protein
MINYGFENEKFYIEYRGCSRPAGTLREEAEQRALDIANSSEKIMLGFSGGLDSQIMVHSLRQVGAQFETAFLYLPGYNDHEYEQVKFLDNKYQIKTHIVDLDPMSVKDEVISLSEEYDIPGRNHILQMMFLKLLPNDVDFIQMVNIPYFWNTPCYTGMKYILGYYHPEISRKRALAKVERTGKVLYFDDTPEYFLSLIRDKIFEGGHRSGRYFDENNVDLPDLYLKSDDRWDFYIKPIMYGAYWNTELTYFPKSQGFEKIQYLKGNPVWSKHVTSIWWSSLIRVLNSPTGYVKVFEYEQPAKES